VARWCRLLAGSGVPADPRDLLLADSPRPSPAPGAVVVHPGASAPARQWPLERFAVVARALRADGHRVVVTGAGGELAAARAVAAAAGLPGHDVLAGRTDLLALAALVGSARLVVSGDTGVAHLASAYGTPSVTLFGPTPPRWWGPPPRRRHAVLWHGTTATDPHAAAPAGALLAITADEVLAAGRARLRAHPAGAGVTSGAECASTAPARPGLPREAAGEGAPRR
jgi:ADP-heptose:LPS heptosyltransferase